MINRISSHIGASDRFVNKSLRFIPLYDFEYTLIPNNDLTYTLIPNNDFSGNLIPGDDIIYTLLPNNDLAYRIIPNNDGTYTLIPDNDLSASILYPTPQPTATPGPTPTPTQLNCDLMKLDPHVLNNPNGIVDYTGNGYDGVMNGTFVTQMYGNYPTVLFNGTDNYIAPPSFGTQLNTGTGFSYEMLVRPTTLDNGTLISEWENNVGSGWNDAQVAFVNGYINAGVYDLGYITGPAFTPNNWYHIVLTYNGLNETTLYVNNVSYGPISGEKTSNNNTLITLGAPDLGGSYLGGATGYFQGELSYWSVYRCYLTSEAVAASYNNSLQRLILPTPTPTPTATEVPPTPTPSSTPTPTATEIPPTATPTPSPTEIPFDFVITSDCISNGRVITSGYTGGSGSYDRSSGIFVTENDALNSTSWAQIINNAGTAGTNIGQNGTYWVAVRDRNNFNLKLAKSITLACATPTPTATQTPTPTPTATAINPLILSYDPSSTSSYPGTGTTLNDLSGNSLAGTLSNITFTNPYLAFNGTSSTILTNDNTLLEPGTGDFSIEVWVRFTTISGSSKCILTKTDGGLAADWGYGIRTTSAGATYMEVGNGSTTVTTPTFTLSPGGWYQIVGVWENVSTNALTLYVNGANRGSNSHSFTSIKNTTRPLSLGSFDGGTTFGQWFNGRMGIVRYYNTALTASEISTSYTTNRTKYEF